MKNYRHSLPPLDYLMFFASYSISKNWHQNGSTGQI